MVLTMICGWIQKFNDFLICRLNCAVFKVTEMELRRQSAKRSSRSLINSNNRTSLAGIEEGGVFFFFLFLFLLIFGFSGSEMVIVQPSRDSFASLEHSNSTLRASSKAVPALWEQDSSALGEIRRSGSDMYLSQTLLLGDESSPILSHINPSTPQTAQSQSNIHIENTPLLGRKQSVPPARVTDSGRKPSVPETTPGTTLLLNHLSVANFLFLAVRTLTESRIRPATPPSLPGDISPVFARQGLEVVNVRIRLDVSLLLLTKNPGSKNDAARANSHVEGFSISGASWSRWFRIGVSCN
jgi:hypothetical protein